MATQQKTKHYASMNKRTWGQRLRGTGIGFTMIYQEYRQRVLQDQPNLAEEEIRKMYHQETVRLLKEHLTEDRRCCEMKYGRNKDIVASLIFAGIILAYSLVFSVHLEPNRITERLFDTACSVFHVDCD